MTGPELVTLHEVLFGVRGALFEAPGRVNLIGEHTDYSDGFVMPAAIDFCTQVVVSPRTDGRIGLHSVDFNEDVEETIATLLGKKRGEWTDYPVGVVWALAEKGVTVPGGFNLTMAGDVPLGAGLSSSASVEVATALGVLSLAGRTMRPQDVAVACRRAENGFVGANVGIMDQFVVACGRRGHALMLDCRSLAFELAPIPEEVRMVICNSMVKHSNSDGAYNTRRAEIEEGLAILQGHRPEIKALRDATMDDLGRWGREMKDNVMRRCRHVITEDIRVLAAAEAFKRSDLERFGQLMHEAYLSFRDDFAASCAEIDVLVTLADKQAGCYGARLTGGGFGGCTVNLVKAEAVEGFVAAMRAGYREATGIEAEIYVSKASDGAHEVVG